MNKKSEKESSYEKVTRKTCNIESYHNIALNDVCDCLKHDDAISEILNAFKNRKDVDEMIIDALKWNPKFWFYVIIPVIIISILISCTLGYCFYRSPATSVHAFEKAINSQIPELLSSS
jgi:hypothetical protein